MYEDDLNRGSTEGRNGFRYLAEAMVASGLDHFFHMPLVLPEVVKELHGLGARPIVTHSEKAAAYMADGYGRASGRIGVCGAQQIGSANLAAGMLDALMAHSPVLALTGGGTPQTRHRNNYQEVDLQAVWGGLTKMTARVEAGDRLPDLMAQAMRVATTGAPGPVHLELNGYTGGVLEEPVGAVAVPDARFAVAPALRHAAPDADVVTAAEALASAQRPVIVAGSGIRASRAQEALRRFALRAAIPVATSLDAKAALPESDPLSIGVIGTYSRHTANRLVAEADLVLFVGTTSGSMTTTTWQVPAAGVRALQIDVDPRELGRNYPLEVSLCGDPATVLDQLSAAFAQSPNRDSWLARTAQARQEWDDHAQEHERTNASPVRPEALCRRLSNALPENALLVVDTGHTAVWTARHIYLDKPGQSLLRAAGSLGWSYPASLGAKCAQPDRPVLCLTGDGGFLYHMAEMETAVRYGIATVTVVNNNAGLSQERTLWDDVPEWQHAWQFVPTDYSAAAQAFGHKAIKVDTPSAIETAVADALAMNEPVLVEVIGDEQALASPPWTP